ncbi:ABC transporter substrate-binding protein [Falsiroseomonas tokyonensis]|uniref:ABC transporter substrate-binding protein n=1 Tax=Falsiroseomonas tokyonensis TaxID=430521 RepID=A0ABV7C4Z9_9PROT
MIPWLAESWQTSADGLTWTFRPVGNAKFNNGDVLDAEAVRFSFQRGHLLDAVAAPEAGECGGGGCAHRALHAGTRLSRLHLLPAAVVRGEPEAGDGECGRGR